jgi:predicted flap endonuclease-1-like 5' DNA nuclease
MVLAVLLLLAGRQIRTRMLLDDQGHWRDRMWLDELVLPDTALAAGSGGKKAKQKLTGPIPINTCSEDSLRLLPGVGKVMASRIAEARKNGLVFSSAEDLKLIKGIGKKLSARLDTLVIYLQEAELSVEPPDSSTIKNFTKPQ